MDQRCRLTGASGEAIVAPGNTHPDSRGRVYADLNGQRPANAGFVAQRVNSEAIHEGGAPDEDSRQARAGKNTVPAPKSRGIACGAEKASPREGEADEALVIPLLG